MGMKEKKIILARTLIAEQRFLCPLCGELMVFSDCNVDHVIPRCRGGRDDLGNLQLVHPKCNLAKGRRLPEGLDETQHPFVKKTRTQAHKDRAKKYKTKISKMRMKKTCPSRLAYAIEMKKRMKLYYAEVDARYEELHPI